MEQLDGVGQNQAFITPLGTNFAFQGWGRSIPGHPNDGIRDVFGTMISTLNRGDNYPDGGLPQFMMTPEIFITARNGF